MNTCYNLRLFPVFAACILVSFYALADAPKAKINTDESFKLVQKFPGTDNKSISFDASIIASPLIDFSEGKPLVIVPASNGVIAALDSNSGRMEWQINAPTPEGQTAELVATPVKIGDKLIIIYQCSNKGVRTSHRAAVIDLSKKQLDDSFPVLEFSAEKPGADPGTTVKFNPATAYSHAALKHVNIPGKNLGLVYAGFGNASDVQPFHGWLFEIDMDAWKLSGHDKSKSAINNVLLTTPEPKCPITTTWGGTQEMICGGGIWSPRGIQIFTDKTAVELLVPTGNGQQDLARQDYANTLMRLKPGLKFDPECDASLCKNFYPKEPAEACMASCKNLFIPRLVKGNAPIRPASSGGECDKKTFAECLAWMDYDLGANSPIKVALSNGQSVLVQPGKEGGVYLIDAEHLGTLYDRRQIVNVCGTPKDDCRLTWAGMIVTQPVQTSINGEPVVIIPTFTSDSSNPAGLVALKIVLENGKPKFKSHWQFPNPVSPDAIKLFRSHPSFPVLFTPQGSDEPLVWIVDIGMQGTLYAVRVRDGKVMVKQLLQGAGRQLSLPLFHDNSVYLASIMPNTGKALIEAFRINTVK